MNNFLREHLTFDQANIVVESTDNSKGGKDLYMKGICIQGGVRNANQRVYPVKKLVGLSKLSMIKYPEDIVYSGKLIIQKALILT